MGVGGTYQNVMRIDIYRKIGDIDQSVWDAAVGSDQIIKSHRFLSAVEHSNINGCKYWYLLMRENGCVLANASIFSMGFWLDVLAPEIIKRVSEEIRRLVPNFLRTKVVGCGTPLATCSSGFAIAEGKRYQEIVALLMSKILEIASQESADCIVFKEFALKEVEGIDGLLTGNGFMRLDSLPTTFIDVRWNTFDEYLVSLRKKYRLFIKNDLKKLESRGLSTEISEDFGNYGSELWTLYMNVYKKAEVKFEQLTPEFFEQVSKYLKGEARVLLIRQNGKIVAFELILEDDTLLRPMYLGIDYRSNPETHLYFNSIYQIIRHGIEKGKRSIELGQTSYYPKLKVGARVEPLYLYIKFSKPFVQRLLGGPLRFMFPKRKFALKDVFKTETREKK